MGHPATKAFLERVKAAEQKFKERKSAMPELPPLTREISTRINVMCPPSTYRLITYLWENNGARSDEISARVAIGNVSDAASRPAARDAQQELGLAIMCEVCPSINRYGQSGSIGRWWLSVTDMNKLYPEPANDSEYAIQDEA